MLFNSFDFLIFFILVTSLYFILPFKIRWILLLASSCYFYMAFIPIYILILIFTIIVDYFSGIQIEKAQGTKRNLYLIFSLIANIGVLAVFKYYNFINSNLSFLCKGFGFSDPLPYLSIILPIGLSFHTFQAMSYTIEVYRGNFKAERHFGLYALYVMFYPQLVAGPIERPHNLLYQFRTKFDFDYDRVTIGLRLMGWGLFKKVVIADRLAIVVDNVFSNPYRYNSLSLLIATIFFSFQIFCDFSGYSDMAIGAARVMGFRLMNNFDKPYHAKSIQEFWKRWHISLSTWFKDYLYISLGGNRVTIPRWYLNLIIVFLVSGLWHGAKWSFVIWGALHGIYIVAGQMSRRHRERVRTFFRLDKIPTVSVLTTYALVTLGWVFFRANDVKSAFYIVMHIVTGVLPLLYKHLIFKHPIFEDLGIPFPMLVFSVFLIFLLETTHYIQSRVNIHQMIIQKSPIVRWAIYYGMILSIVVLGVFDKRQFIYFQF